VTVDTAVTLPSPFVANQVYIRDMDLGGSRMAVVGNTISNCQCHGILAQNPNTLVDSNSIGPIRNSAIRVQTFMGIPQTFQEGVGGINVLVSNNNVASTGIDTDLPGGSSIPYAAISSYGAWANGLISTYPANKWVNFTGNTVSDSDQDCIMVANTETSNVTSNACKYDNVTTTGSPSIYLYYSDTVNVQSNTRLGTSTGPITESHTTNYTIQSTY
jgi:hypothetical protein